MQGRNEGGKGKGRNTPGAESLCRICSEKYICFRKMSGSNIGAPNLLLAQSTISPRYAPDTQVD